MTRQTPSASRRPARHKLSLLRPAAGAGTTIAAWSAILGLLVLATALGQTAPGLRSAYPYLMLGPVLFAAALHGLSGGVLAALVASLLVGPAMPVHAGDGLSPELGGWFLNGAIYLGVGGIGGTVFGLLHRRTQALRRMLRTDGRTGLASGLALEEDLSAALALAQPPAQAVGLILAHAADGRNIGATYGVEIEPELMRLLAHRLGASVRRPVQVYSAGDSELRLLVTDTDAEELEALVAAFAEAGDATFHPCDIPLRIRLTFGYTLQASPATTASELIRQSRLAEAMARRQQSATCRYTLRHEALSLAPIAAIRKVSNGLRNGEFQLRYQPRIRLSDNAVVGCEALLRWRQGDGKALPPEKLLPQVEKTTLAVAMSRCLIEQACAFLKTSEIPILYLDLFAEAFLDRELRDYLPALSRKRRLRPERMGIQVGGHALTADPASATRVLEQYRGHGFRVELRQFVGGFASVDQLLHLPLNGIRIAPPLVHRIHTDDRVLPLLRGLISTAHAAGLKVTAEGVEKSIQHDVLCEAGCDHAQGSLYGQPMQRDAFHEWVEKWSQALPTSQSPRYADSFALPLPKGDFSNRHRRWKKNPL